jgi:hypothetical protein
MLRLGWIKPAESIEVRFGTSRARAVDVALYRVADVDCAPGRSPPLRDGRRSGAGATWRKTCGAPAALHDCTRRSVLIPRFSGLYVALKPVGLMWLTRRSSDSAVASALSLDASRAGGSRSSRFRCAQRIPVESTARWTPGSAGFASLHRIERAEEQGL